MYWLKSGSQESFFNFMITTHVFPVIHPQLIVLLFDAAPGCVVLPQTASESHSSPRCDISRPRSTTSEANSTPSAKPTNNGETVATSKSGTQPHRGPGVMFDSLHVLCLHPPVVSLPDLHPHPTCDVPILHHRMMHCVKPSVVILPTVTLPRLFLSDVQACLQHFHVSNDVYAWLINLPCESIKMQHVSTAHWV